MNLTLRQLRAFVAVAELSQFTLAAERLHITQSALSMLIRELEKELELKLFDRHTRMVRLTEHGEEFLLTARRVLNELEVAVMQSRESVNYKRGRVAVACSTVLAVTLLTPFMREFAQRHPGIKLILRDVAEESIKKRLLNGDVDFSVGTQLNPESEISELPIFSDHFVLLMPKGHPLTKQTRIPLQAISQYPVIAMAPSSSIRAVLEAHLKKLDITLNIAYEASFPSTIIAMVRNGMGITILPANAHQLTSTQGIVVRNFGKSNFIRTVCTFQLRNRSLSPAAELFHTELLEYVVRHRSKLTALP
ncbi:LysR family transcriptional regulator [Herminiimonas glaciei]|uniref:LysR family transcriptional regulator n=1 Tax=Herminiimonas glaciei TaxID=523788 RepID=A0ABW2I6Q0_9BURK